jgi:hypothetical protein
VSQHHELVGAPQKWLVRLFASCALVVTLLASCGQSGSTGSGATEVPVSTAPGSGPSAPSAVGGSTLPAVVTTTTAAPADSTVALGGGDVVAQLIGQSYVFNVDDLNSGSLPRVGSVVMPDGTRVMSESSIGFASALLIISVPDRGPVVLLTAASAEPASGTPVRYQVVDGQEVALVQDERILSSDCLLDGRDAQGRVVAVLPTEPESGDNIPARRAWLVSDDGRRLDDLDPARLTCSLSNPD